MGVHSQYATVLVSLNDILTLLLQIRLYMMASSSGFQDTVPEKFINYGPAGRLTLRAVKMYADGEFSSKASVPGRFFLLKFLMSTRTCSGALGSWGAALREPYTDHPETKGLLLTEPKELRKHARRFWEAGLQVVSELDHRVYHDSEGLF